MASWILHHDEENPFYRNYDYLLEMSQEYDFGLSLGDGMRPGAIFDSTDYAQIMELLEISKLVERAREKKVQVFVEGPGHIPAHQVVEPEHSEEDWMHAPQRQGVTRERAHAPHGSSLTPTPR